MTGDSSCSLQLRPDRQIGSSVLPGALLVLLLSGCNAPSLEEPASSLEVESARSMLEGQDGLPLRLMSTNGLGTNGLGTNGLGTNGLGTNGLSLSTLDSLAFVDWFNQDSSLSDSVMKYIVACAVKAGSSLTWVNPTTGQAYTWEGNLGLTPGWAGGAPATEVEQQLITACLAAHTNKYGIQVPISIQGLDATSAPIPVTSTELTTFSEREACFFGNLFQNQGVFAGSDSSWSITDSSARACGLESAKTTNLCPPIQVVGACMQSCTIDSKRGYYVSCTYNRKQYRALTTRIRSQDVYRCGDGVCQLSESCGIGTTPSDCRDCGACPSK